VQAGENRRHDPDHTFAALVHVGIVTSFAFSSPRDILCLGEIFMADAKGEIVSFGFEDFWPQASKEYADVFPVLAKLVALMNEMLDVADKKRNGELELSVTCLTRMTGFGMNDVMILCGNGSGVGAIKIGRGMFETSLLAEYLRRNPNEVSDYVDFGPVLAWRRLQTLRGKKRQGMAPEMVKQLEGEYNSVKGRFLNSKGNVRSQWTTKKISQMAEELGRSDQYALVYGLACSLHHANFEGLMGHCDTKNGRLKMDGPPSFAWTGAALIAAVESRRSISFRAFASDAPSSRRIAERSEESWGPFF
jgi:hypothetical protein